ncbi:MAG: YbhB/YbcL family Raf kinase inhibitor-like protein [Anaerolineae bacterium]|nr:YbhB/YbcL family Raf kinase inhibitor-like protein [Anaerolineae bacterium]
MRCARWIFSWLICVLLVGCGDSATQTPVNLNFTLSSPAFVHENAIPPQYTCDGNNLSPALEWSEPPAGTQSLALIVDDPDAPAGTWVHWVVYNIPPDARGFAEAYSAGPDDGSRNGKNSSRNLGYDGPCPPSGTHRYFFKLYALDTLLDLDSGATAAQLLKAVEGHVLAQAELMGTYAR